jgi:excinuclease ABC subunit C
MMLEVLRRRYRRALEEDDFPDLLMVDGGKGQLQMAVRVLDELGITDLDVVGIAKSRLQVDEGTGNRHHSDERLFLPGRKNAVTFLPNSPALHVLVRVRDEAHRFAITYHKNLRSKQTLRSELDDIAGVGAGRRTQLLRHFGSLKQIRGASLLELKSVPGLPERVAQAVYDHFHAHTPSVVDPVI